MAAALVIVMAVSLFPIVDQDGGLDAIVGDGGAYSYTITYDSSAMSTTSAAISTADMTPISSPSYSGGVTSGYGSWEWNTTTGVGPFNSFYAAFDMSNGNRFVDILNPFDLTETINGVDITSDLSHYNIMWVLPTVYWSSTSTTLTLTNDSTSGGVAYAHTVDGHVYRYIAIGVYEASTATVNDLTVLTSTSGATPTVSQSRATFRTYAHNYTMNSDLATNVSNPAYSMLWTFYQWELYKYCSLTLMENFNSQNTVGNGYVYNSGSNQVTTGSTNASGPYAGNPGLITDASTYATYGSDSVKLFIENAWGGLWEFVDGVVVNGTSGFYIDTKDTPDDSNTAGGYVTYYQQALMATEGYATDIMTDPQVWGYQTGSANGSATTGVTDYCWTSGSADRVFCVAGYAPNSATDAVKYGLSVSASTSALSHSANYIGSRLAFVFDADFMPKDITVSVEPSGYGTLSSGSSSGQSSISLNDVPYGRTISVSGNVLTVDGTTVTATYTAADAQYTYSFSGWEVNGSPISSPMTVTDDMTITAKFSRVVNTYNVTVSSSNPEYGTVTVVGNISNTPYGSVIHLSGTNNNILSLNGSVVTATAADPTAYYTYSFDGYTNSGIQVQDGDTITGATTLIANFGSTAIYTVLITPNDNTYGTVTVDQIIGVPTGSDFTVTDNVIEIYNTESTATPSANTAQYSYGFDNFTIGGVEVETGDTISSDVTVIANFTRTVNEYTVYVESNDTDWGTVSAASFSDVPYGSTITVNGANLIIGGDFISATIVGVDDAQYTYGFDGWYVGTTKIGSTGVLSDDDTTITAVFTRTVNEYTITWELYDDLTDTTEVEYGTVPTYTPALRPGWSFVGWTPTPVAVTGTATYTAIWSELPPITVTFDGNGGAPAYPTKEVYYGQPYGSLPTAHMTNMQLVGWFTAPEGGEQVYTDTIVTDENAHTLYAQWRVAEYYSTLLTVVDMIPLICVIAIIFGLIGTALYYRTE